MSLDPRTPVLVGAGVAHQHVDDPDAALEAIELMAQACERAAPASLLARAQSILVPRGTWRYRDPGRLLATRFGADARTVIGEFGILQQTLVTRACTAIARGDLDVALVVGGEAKYRDLRAQIAGTRASETEQAGRRLRTTCSSPPPTSSRRSRSPPASPSRPRSTRSSRPRCAPRAARRWRRTRGDLAELWAGFSEIAATNPDAWRRDAIAPEFLSSPSDKNPMYAAPYTRWHCSQWNVDQASAFVVCSAEAAERSGVARENWVFPLAAVESNAMVPLSQRGELHRSPAVSAGRDQLAEMSGVDPRDADHVDLYSCFPSAVQVQADALGLGPDRPLTVTGGMTFAGGPLDNYNFQALAKMVEVLREQPGTTGLVTCISGMITKHGMAMWSTTSACRRLPLRRRVRRDERAYRGARPRARPRRARAHRRVHGGALTRRRARARHRRRHHS